MILLMEFKSVTSPNFEKLSFFHFLHLLTQILSSLKSDR